MCHLWYIRQYKYLRVRPLRWANSGFGLVHFGGKTMASVCPLWREKKLKNAPFGAFSFVDKSLAKFDTFGIVEDTNTFGSTRFGGR